MKRKETKNIKERGKIEGRKSNDNRIIEGRKERKERKNGEEENQGNRTKGKFEMNYRGGGVKRKQLRTEIIIDIFDTQM